MVSSKDTDGVWCSFSASTVLTNFSKVAILICWKCSEYFKMNVVSEEGSITGAILNEHSEYELRVIWITHHRVDNYFLHLKSG